MKFEYRLFIVLSFLFLSMGCIQEIPTKTDRTNIEFNDGKREVDQFISENINKINKKNKSDLINYDTIRITAKEFKNKIVFSEESLFDHCRPVDIECSIDAETLLTYLSQEVNEVYSEKLIENNLFTRKELSELLNHLKDYIKEEIDKNGIMKLECPKSGTSPKIRKMLKEMDFAIYYIFRWSYFSDMMKKGEVKFHNKKIKKEYEEIYKLSTEEGNSIRYEYFLEPNKRRFYSELRNK